MRVFPVEDVNDEDRESEITEREDSKADPINSRSYRLSPCAAKL